MPRIEKTYKNKKNIFYIVGYTVDDVMYRWTEGDGCNIEPDLELSQFDIGEIKINTTTTDINKGKNLFLEMRQQ